MDVSVEQAERIVDVMYDLDLTEAQVYEDYSGRGMYGKTCTALTGDVEIVRDVGIALGWLIANDEIDSQEAMAWFSRQDQLGLGVVIY